MIKPEHSSAPVKVAQVVETMTMGGAENLAVRIANALPKEGYESHLVVITEPGVLSGRIDPSVKVHYLHFHRASIRNPIAFPFSIISGARRLSRLMRRQGIGLAQTHLPGANFWGLLLQLMGVCPVLATIHNNQEFKYGDADSPVRGRFRRWAYKGIVNRCAGTIAVSQEVKKSLVRDLDLDKDAEARISVVTNGVSIPDPLDENSRQAVRRALGVGLEIPLVLAAGRFGPQKNFGDLIKIAALLKNHEASFQLVIAGEGEQLEELRSQVTDLGLGGLVFLPGNLQNLGQVMLAADVFVMTSLWEGLPLVLLEAMAAALPAVAYAIAGVTELVEEGKTGYLAQVGDSGVFAARLEALLTEQSRRRDLGQNSRRRVTADFNFEDLVENLAAKYLEIG